MSDALRIDPSRGRLPPPSADLFEKMARAGSEITRGLNPELPLPESWEKMEEGPRDDWIACARAMYAVVAKAGGARVEVIKDQSGED